MIRRKGHAAVSDHWSYRDQVLLATLEIVRDTLAGDLDRRPLLTGRFALQHEDERMVASGAYGLSWWGAVGDGSYVVGGGFVAGTGVLGVGLTVGSLIGNGVARSRARAMAAADATVWWRPVDNGNVHVTTHGFYLTDGVHGFRHFSWSCIVQSDLVGHGLLQFTAETTDGTQTFLIVSDWAELMLAYWAMACHPHHPQWLDQSWYPFDVMRERARHHSIELPRLGVEPGR